MAADLWQDVRRELDCWGDQGLSARFWVRDDDACELSAQLTRLQGLAERHQINIGLAVIPGRIQHDLLDALPSLKAAFHPMCHGWVHANYGRPGKPEEFGSNRPFADIRGDAERAYRAFSGYFGATNAFFVPPFGRVTSALIKDLQRIGFAAVSMGPTFLERVALRVHSRLPWSPIVRVESSSPIPRFDVHIDVIDWTRRTAQDSRWIAAKIVENLRLRRRGFVACDCPIGIVTHHLAHDEPVWRLCNDLLAFLREHSATKLLDAARLINTPDRSVGVCRRIASASA